VGRLTASLRVELFPADLDRFVDFYTRVLRFTLEVDRREDGGGYAAVARGSVRIGAVKAWRALDSASRVPPAGAELVLEVDAVDAEHAAVVASGWPIDAGLQEQPWGLRDFRVFDPDGYYLRITNRA
jgi:lactoylglutathione lyase